MIKYAFSTIAALMITLYTGADVEREQYLNYAASLTNSSNFDLFTVIKVKDLNSGAIKELCTKGNFILGALDLEYAANAKNDGSGKVLSRAIANRRRYFEFRSKKALENINFYTYKPDELRRIERRYDFRKVISNIKATKAFSASLSREEMRYVAHVLFSNGYLTGESACFGGTLVYVKREQLEQR